MAPMKEKTSITLSREILRDIDKLSGSKRSRSAFIENVLLHYLRESARSQRDARELQLINTNAEQLNRDALEGLALQAPVGDFPEE